MTSADICCLCAERMASDKNYLIYHDSVRSGWCPFNRVNGTYCMIQCKKAVLKKGCAYRLEQSLVGTEK